MGLGTLAKLYFRHTPLGWGLRAAGGIANRMRQNGWNHQKVGNMVRSAGGTDTLDKVIKYTPRGTLRNNLQQISNAAHQRGMYAQTKHQRVIV